MRSKALMRLQTETIRSVKEPSGWSTIAVFAAACAVGVPLRGLLFTLLLLLLADSCRRTTDGGLGRGLLLLLLVLVLVRSAACSNRVVPLLLLTMPPIPTDADGATTAVSSAGTVVTSGSDATV